MDEEVKHTEWTRYQIVLPEDEPDEDDALDAHIEKMARKKKDRVSRGNFRGV